MTLEFTVTKIGAIAVETLTGEFEGKVVGVTSKGVFLRFENKIVFLTDADYNSPFNLIVDTGVNIEGVEVNEQALVKDRVLSFSARRLSFDFSNAAVWNPPEPVKMVAPPSQQLVQASKLAFEMKHIDPAKGYLFLLDGGNSSGLYSSQRTIESVYRMMRGYSQQDVAVFLEGCRGLLGSGGGLTPSGDDFISGFFLYHIRYDLASNQRRTSLQDLFKAVALLAEQKTTTISANRIQAAGRGWSEELFLTLIDSLFNPHVQLPQNFLQILMNFGHSSGVDTFMGILFGIKSIVNEIH